MKFGQNMDVDDPKDGPEGQGSKVKFIRSKTLSWVSFDSFTDKKRSHCQGSHGSRSKVTGVKLKSHWGQVRPKTCQNGRWAHINVKLLHFLQSWTFPLEMEIKNYCRLILPPCFLLSFFEMKLLLIYFQRKCEQYWPDEGEKLYGSVLVKILDTEMTSDFIIRTFEISKVSAKSKERKCPATSCMICWLLLFHKRKLFCCHLLNFNVSTLFLPLISGW